jgi:hypothetical protein
MNIMQILPEGIIIFDNDNKMSINYANKSALRLLSVYSG